MVYDPLNDAVHLLDPTTASVLRLLQEGGRTVDEITAEVAKRNNYAPSEGLLMLAIDELRHARLLDEPEGARERLKGAGMFRRAMMKKVVAAGAAAFIVPAIVTLSANDAYGQSSACVAHDDCCTPGQVCCNAKDNCEPDKKCATGFHCH
jgi:hypothetical protein